MIPTSVFNSSALTLVRFVASTASTVIPLNPGGPTNLTRTCSFTLNPGSCNCPINTFSTSNKAVSNTSMLSLARSTTRDATDGSHAPNSVREHVTLWCRCSSSLSTRASSSRTSCR